ncbi:MAG: hypothetical protein DHS20C12_06420 [Pseudohongiella sp.]|nr:MAG: hypothetical protein DHS20C12_06420 [Pseudohongiella sp.]
MLNDVLDSILKLLKLKKDAEKTDLEIERLKREKEDSQRLIKVASIEDIQKYDDRQRDLHQSIQASQPVGIEVEVDTRAGSGGLVKVIVGVVVLSVLIVGVYWVFGS